MPTVAELRQELITPDDVLIPAGTDSLIDDKRELFAALGGPCNRRASRMGDTQDASTARNNTPTNTKRNVGSKADPPSGDANSGITFGSPRLSSTKSRN